MIERPKNMEVSTLELVIETVIVCMILVLCPIADSVAYLSKMMLFTDIITSFLSIEPCQNEYYETIDLNGYYFYLFLLAQLNFVTPIIYDYIKFKYEDMDDFALEMKETVNEYLSAFGVLFIFKLANKIANN